MEGKETFYHGSGVLFDSFDLEHALEGDGKVKFGYGVYVTSAYPSAAHYSGSNDNWTKHYVYSIVVPAKSTDNFIAFKQPVNPEIVKRAEDKLGIKIPEKFTVDGKEFRKFLANRFSKEINVEGKSKNEITLIGEKEASAFLLSLGVDFIEWPYNWKNPTLGTNRAYLDDKKIEITRIDQIELDNKKKLIPNSEKQIR